MRDQTKLKVKFVSADLILCICTNFHKHVICFNFRSFCFKCIWWEIKDHFFALKRLGSSHLLDRSTKQECVIFANFDAQTQSSFNFWVAFFKMIFRLKCDEFLFFLCTVNRKISSKEVRMIVDIGIFVERKMNIWITNNANFG